MPMAAVVSLSAVRNVWTVKGTISLMRELDNQLSRLVFHIVRRKVTGSQPLTVKMPLRVRRYVDWLAGRHHF